MVDRITNAVVGRTTMRIIPESSVIESSGEFADVLHTTTKVENTGEDTDYETIFKNASATYGVPLELLKAVAKAESSFNPKSVSRSGAMGVMQLMPETAEELGVEDAFNPEENIMGGADYLAQKLLQYGGDVELALAAYNAGSGNVDKYGGIPPFEETQNYVKKVTAYMEKYKQETETVSVQNTKEADANTVTAGMVSSYNTGVTALEAYERMKDETYWKVLK